MALCHQEQSLKDLLDKAKVAMHIFVSVLKVDGIFRAHLPRSIRYPLCTEAKKRENFPKKLAKSMESRVILRPIRTRTNDVVNICIF